ncbi:MAG: 4-hydroxybenzoate 3-monooxygenase [Sphingomonadaceae bacterium]|nr:4-hydroxybenzoate 3-monooxygenase [Sphingomonadaceae bacterium]
MEISRFKTQVAIIGAGPAGLMLGHALMLEGIDCIILERQTREHVEARIRAGVLEQVTTDMMARLGLNDRLSKEGLLHEAVVLLSEGSMIPVAITRHTGKHVTVYGQTELTKDLIAAAEDRGLPIVWEAKDVALHDIEGTAPYVTYGAGHRVDCAIIAGCDGYHGPSRYAIPAKVRREFERVYPFGWLGILADVPPCHAEVAYASHDRGFALASMRSMTRSRYYLQVGLDEQVEDWSDERFWDELCTRLGPKLGGQVTRGRSIEKSIAPLRSYVSEPMRHARLFLAGDATHIVPPTGAKGLNLAASDVTYLADALLDWFKKGTSAGIDGYSAQALRRVWKTERFSWYLTELMHRFPDGGAFDRRMQDAELDYIANSDAAQAMIAENYVGLAL